MKPELILNELSLRPIAPTVFQARARMFTLVQTITAATSSGAKRSLRHDISDFDLAPSYPLSKWRNDNEVDRDARSYWKNLETKYPLENDLAEIADKALGYEFFLNESEAKGLGYVWLTDSIALSLANTERWDVTSLDLEMRYLDEEDGLIHAVEPIRHASQRAHIQHHALWLKSINRIQIESGEELWQNRAAVFPHLAFCDVVEDQLRELRPPEMLKQVLQWLDRLNDYCSAWQHGSFDHHMISGNNISPETQMTMDQYGLSHRTFRCPDGERREFSWHCKLALQAWRIHFVHELGPGHIVIGYIGKHLPTVKFRT